MKIVNKVSYFFDKCDRELLYDYLRVQGIDLKELAEKLDISISYLYMIIQGHRPMTSELRRKMNEIGVII